MDAFKKFLKGKKVEKHFKKTGGGAKLGDGAASSKGRPTAQQGYEQGGHQSVDKIAQADIAAQAAYKRLLAKEQPKSSYTQKIQMLARKELDQERALKEETAKVEEQMSSLHIQRGRLTDERQPERDKIDGVFFTCELLNDDVALEKQELLRVIEEFLREQVALAEDDALIPAVMMLYTLNKKEIRQTAVETIAKYLRNIAEYPDQAKFRRIRTSNAAFQDRVAKAIGGREVLNAVGFKEFMDGDPPEIYLTISEEKAIDTAQIVLALDTLEKGQAVPFKIARDTKAFIVAEGVKVPHPEVPLDFYDLTAAELLNEQQLLKERAERMLTLRTQEMRNRENFQRNYKYKYTVLRVRFPDRLILQGTFGVYEPLLAVREWLSDHVAHPATPFHLKHANNSLDGDTIMLGDQGLAPCAVLHLEWAEPVNAPSLKNSLLEKVQPIDP